MTVAFEQPASATKPSHTAPTRTVELPVGRVTAEGAAVPVTALMHARFAYFMSELRDETGKPLIVAEHHEEWADLMQFSALLVLLAPRDHGKTWTDIAYLIWRCWRHNRDAQTGELLEDQPEGRFQAVLFSDTLPQAEIFFDLFQTLTLANLDLMGDILPLTSRATGNRGAWSKRRVRFRNAAEVIIRGYRTSTRGLHPDLVLLDDVLNDQNTLTAYQRNRAWRYFIGTLLPMNAKQYIVVGTAFHYDDLLHRLRPTPDKAPLVINNRKVSFRWVKYRSVNWDTKVVLWAERHSYDDLLGRRDVDALIFSREYQNDPRDDTASLFPWELTKQALDPGLTFVPGYRKTADEWVVFGADFAMSEAVGADYTVVMVAAVNRHTLSRRILRAWRVKGASFGDQVKLLRDACAFYDVDLGVMEENSFQKWVHDETRLYPETAGRIIGHRTGGERGTMAEGIPSIKMSLQQGLWVLPASARDPEAVQFAHAWQSELSAFGWKDDKLQGVGEHDDTVIATWLTDRAVRQVQRWVDAGPAEQVVTGEDVGIQRVRIGEEY